MSLELKLQSRRTGVGISKSELILSLFIEESQQQRSKEIVVE